ncbi:hypothetical protein [Ochrobactrum sp. Marseille-Q0166]|uniref:hypothetical protein n=1 Tax=Ochrobactrum sp. Marseille-Q0166 TaxID=2761105 RepID=UPI001655490A|nr:hypothetical protein [Ochrobactrum sp. Marseille-Q0166]MBC8719956.1 hypothetical protein [Ochrobactrum sp. Marseille-Q0166]
MACSVDDTATRPDQDHILAIRPGHARMEANEAQNKESSSFTERQGLPRAGQAAPSMPLRTRWLQQTAWAEVRPVFGFAS